MNDPISDMLTRIRNATRALHPMVEMPALQAEGEHRLHPKAQEGYIVDFSVEGKIPRSAQAEA